jgi:hypothetical protein
MDFFIFSKQFPVAFTLTLLDAKSNTHSIFNKRWEVLSYHYTLKGIHEKDADKYVDGDVSSN